MIFSLFLVAFKYACNRGFFMLRYIEFEWDDYNSGKNLIKHNVSDDEIEQVFVNPYVILRHTKYNEY